MRSAPRKTLPVLILVLLTGAASAETYETTLHQDFEKHFKADGWIISNNNTNTDISVEYNLSLEHKNYNYSKIHSFRIIMADEEDSVFTKDIGSFKLEENGFKYGIATITSSRPPDRIEKVIFRVNHTGTLHDGTKVLRNPRAEIQYSANQINPEIERIKTLNKTADRGKKLYLEITTSEIEQLYIEGRNTTGNRSFKGFINVAKDAPPGPNNRTVKFTTGRGSIFERSVTFNVTNARPTVKTSFEPNITEGHNLTVKVTVSDDTGIDSTVLQFRDEQKTVQKGKAIIDTDGLEPDNYQFKVVSTDTDNHSTTINRNFNVNERKEKTEKKDNENKKQNKNNEDEDEEDEKENETIGNSKEEKKKAKSFPQVITDPLISWITSLF